MSRMVRAPMPKTAVDSPLALLDAELAKRGREGDAQAAGLQQRLALRDFYRGAWPICDPKRFLPNWHVDAVAKHLEAVTDHQLDKLVINMPPGYAKSMLTSVMWPAWQWGPADHPETRWLCVSYGGTSAAPALRDADKCRTLIKSLWYQREWGAKFQLSGTQDAKDLYKNDKFGYRMSAGLDGAVSGQRADIILIDDPTKLDDALSQDTILKASQVWESTLRSRAIDDGSAVVLIMQRLHEEDLAGYFLKQDGWTHLRLPALFEPTERCRVFLHGELFFEDPRQTDGEPLHPLMTKAARDAMELQVTQPWYFASQQQQRPAPLEGGMIKRIDRWATFPSVLDELIIVVDCAFKDNEDNSWVVMQCWGRREANAYLLDQIRAHLDFPATLTTLVEFCGKWPLAAAKWVEAKANGIGIVQMLKTRVPGMLSTDDDDGILHRGGTKIKDTSGKALCLKAFCAGSKEAKLSAVAPYYLAGNVLIPTSDYLHAIGQEDWTPKYVHELQTFPNTRFNDQVDASAMGVWKLLGAFEVHVSPADLLDAGLGLGQMVGVAEKAFGSDDLGIGFELEKGAYGRATSGLTADLGHRAFGS